MLKIRKTLFYGLQVYNFNGSFPLGNCNFVDKKPKIGYYFKYQL